MEEWKMCVEFPHYDVSSFGRVRRNITIRGKPGTILRSWTSGGGYPRVHLRKNGKTVKCLVHRLVGKAFYGMPPGMEIDHIEHDRGDNTRIRVATRAENMRNARPQKHTSRFKGVSWDTSRGKWYACISINNGKTKSLGRYSSEIDAAMAYDDVAYKAWGEFAYLNFPAREGVAS